MIRKVSSLISACMIWFGMADCEPWYGGVGRCQPQLGFVRTNHRRRYFHSSLKRPITEVFTFRSCLNVRTNHNRLYFTPTRNILTNQICSYFYTSRPLQTSLLYVKLKCKEQSQTSLLVLKRKFFYFKRQNLILCSFSRKYFLFKKFSRK